MTLKRLIITVGILVVLLGGGIAWLWQYAYSPQGRARNILCQFKGETQGLRPWLMKHGLAKPVVFDVPPKGMVHLAAARMIGELGPGAVSPVVEMMEDTAPVVRQIGAIVSGILKDERLFVPLTRRLQDENECVRISAVIAIEGFGARSNEPLEKMVETSGRDSSHPMSVGLAAMACGKEAPEAFLGILRDTDNGWYFDLLYYFYHGDSRKALPFLERMRRHAEVRSDVEGLIAEVKTPKGRLDRESPGKGVCDALSRELERTSLRDFAGIFKTACLSSKLATYGDRRALDPMLSVYRQEDIIGNEILPITLAFGEWNDPRAVAALDYLLLDVDLDIRSCAMCSLERLGVKNLLGRQVLAPAAKAN